MAIVIIWIVILTAFALWHGQLAVSPFMRVLTKSRYNYSAWAYRGAIRLFLFLLPIGIAIAVSILASVGVAVVVLSIFASILGMFAYLMCQRFAHFDERLPITDRMPLFLPSTTALSLVLSVLAIVLFVDWFLFAIPILCWLISGFATAEIAIWYHSHRFGKRGNASDRQYAIYQINLNQKRKDLLGSGGRRYPFP